MIKLNASYSRKVPGAQQYSSEQASASVEIELAEGDGPQIQSRLADLWLILRQAVERQLNGNGHHPAPAPAPANGGNGHHAPLQNTPGRNGQASQKAAVSEKQMKFIKSLIGELMPMGVDYAFAEGMCSRLFGRKLEHLDRAQASTLIGHLSEIKAGRLTVQQALAA